MRADFWENLGSQIFSALGSVFWNENLSQIFFKKMVWVFDLAYVAREAPLQVGDTWPIAMMKKNTCESGMHR